MASYVAITSGVAMGWMWISIGYIGYIGMYRLDRVSGHLDSHEIGAIQAEIDLLQALLAIYGFTIVAMVLGLGDIGALVVPGNHARVWFISGIATLLVGLHLSVTAVVFHRYMELIFHIRKAGRSDSS